MNFKDAIRALKGYAIGAPRIPIFLLRHFTMRKDPIALILSVGGPHGGSAWIAERAKNQGFRPFVVSAQFPLRELPWAAGWKRFDILSDHDEISAFAQRLKPQVVISDHRNAVLTLKTRLIEELGLHPFGQLGPKTSNSKIEFRSALDRAAAPNLAWGMLRDLPNQLDALPVLAKPNTGTGSRGVTVLRDPKKAEELVESRRQSGDLENWIFEEMIEGRQFDVEGVCKNGEFHILSVTEERYEERDGAMPSAWFLFSPPIPEEDLQKIRKGALDTLRACGVQSGAFHCELRLTDQGRVAPIDYSNRYGYPIMVSECADVDFIEYYIRTLLPEPFEMPPIQKNAVFQQYAQTRDQRQRFKQLASENPENVIETRALGSVVAGVETFGRFSFKAQNFQQMYELLDKYGLVPEIWESLYANSIAAFKN